MGLVLGALAWRWRATPFCGLLVVQTLALAHNLEPWRSVPDLAKSACVAFGHQLPAGSAPVFVTGLPPTRSGVVFLANGFPRCVQMNTGIDSNRVHVSGQHEGADAFAWDGRGGFIRIGRSK